MNNELPQNSKTSSESSSEAARSQRPQKTRWRRRLLAVCLGLLPFVGLEFGLRVLGVGGQPADLQAGFEPAEVLFVRDDAAGVYRTSLPKEQFFVAQEFPVEKQKDEFRVFCLGGSTVQGRPYRPETAFGQWLQLELGLRDSSRQFRCVNCGGISYASYRLKTVLAEVLQYHPDLIVLATGHNEFLEDRTYADLKQMSAARRAIDRLAQYSRTIMVLRQLAGKAPRQEPTDDESPSRMSEDVEAKLDEDAGYASYHRDDEWHRQVHAQYRDSVDEMLHMCRKHNVPVVLVRLGSNLRDCPPFKSEHRAGLSVEDEQRWQTLFDQAGQLDDTDPQAALELYRQAAEIDDQYPLLHFRIARCLDRLKQFDAARQSYILARDLDICPLRMPSQLADELPGLAEKHNAPLVDAARIVTESSPDGIPGYESYIDHVHPTIGVHQQISRAVADTLVQAGVCRGNSPERAVRRSRFAEHFDTLGPAYFANGRRRIGWLEGWARRQRLYEETVPVDARGYWAAAVRQLDLHEFDSAGEQMLLAVSLDSAVADRLLEHAAGLFEQGRTRDAQWLLNELHDVQPMLSNPQEYYLAQFVVALENNNRDQIRSALDKLGGAISEQLRTSVWLKLKPDALDLIPKA